MKTKQVRSSVGSLVSIAPALLLISAGPGTFTDRAPDHKADLNWVRYLHRDSSDTPSRVLKEVFGPTSDQDEVINELWTMLLLTTNWDGENAQAPNSASIREAVSFVKLLDNTLRVPEAMIHPSGRAGLFWHDSEVYADLEFTGNQLVTYYVEREGGKHKGVVPFDSKSIPRVFSTLLVA